MEEPAAARDGLGSTAIGVNLNRDCAIAAYWDDDARQRFDVPRDEVWAECTKILSFS